MRYLVNLEKSDVDDIVAASEMALSEGGRYPVRLLRALKQHGDYDVPNHLLPADTGSRTVKIDELGNKQHGVVLSDQVEVVDR